MSSPRVSSCSSPAKTRAGILPGLEPSYRLARTRNVSSIALYRCSRQSFSFVSCAAKMQKARTRTAFCSALCEFAPHTFTHETNS